MNHKQRRVVAKVLRAYRKKASCTPEDMAARLGWPVAFYREAEAGKAGLSDGQMADVRRELRKEIKAAAVRDKLRGVAPKKRIPLIGGTRVVEHVPDVEKIDERMQNQGTIGRMPAPWIDTHNLPRDED